MGCNLILPSYALHMLLVPNRRLMGQQVLPSQANPDRADVGRNCWGALPTLGTQSTIQGNSAHQARLSLAGCSAVIASSTAATAISIAGVVSAGLEDASSNDLYLDY